MTDNKTYLWIYGAGGMGMETLWLISEISNYVVDGFIDDFKQCDNFKNLPLIKNAINKSICIPMKISNPLLLFSDVVKPLLKFWAQFLI